MLLGSQASLCLPTWLMAAVAQGRLVCSFPRKGLDSALLWMSCQLIPVTSMKEQVDDLFGRVHGAGNEKALATVTAIIDGMGSCGAALGPLLTGYLSQTAGGFDNVFLMLYAASLAAAALLLHLVVHEVCSFTQCLRS